MKFNPLRQLPPRSDWKKGDVLVIFGEVFQRGYVNGLIEEAQKIGMNIVYSTVGRRDENDNLRPLTADELKEKENPLVNVPLECGFDLQATSSGQKPVDQLEGLKLSDWQTATLKWDSINESQRLAREGFRTRVREYLQKLEVHIPKTANVLVAHTMAGGVPRAKIIMPAMNRVFKGHGDRYASSSEFWQSDLGKFCAANFFEVTADSLAHLLELSEGLRQRQKAGGGTVRYVAYGYHGTEVLVGSNYHWQSYSPYLQGFAKIKLEEIATEYFAKKVAVAVFNAPEILTNSSSIFLGVEVSLYPLLNALQKEAGSNPRVKKIIEQCQNLLKPEATLSTIADYTQKYFSSEVIKKWSQLPLWPQHNGPEQMSAMRQASTELIEMHKDQKQLITAILSEVVFRGCGRLMLHEVAHNQAAVWWIGHDIIAKSEALH